MSDKPDREDRVQAIVDRCGKTREQAEAFIDLVQHALGLEERKYTHEELDTKFDLFLGRHGERDAGM